MATPERLQADILQLEQQIKALQKLLLAKRCLLVELKFPFQVGDVIRYQYGNQIRHGRVQSIQGHQNVPHAVVRILKKNGSPGRLNRVYDWHSPTLLQPAPQK